MTLLKKTNVPNVSRYIQMFLSPTY